jgi:pimeloyl-ACP methyl ester carboxylesterase
MTAEPGRGEERQESDPAPIPNGRGRGRWVQGLLPGRRTGLAAAASVAVLDGLVTGWLMPRGPITTAQGLATVGLSLLVGGWAGLLMRSRWAMLLAPVAFVAVFELARIRTAGPLVDEIRLTSTYGILAFALGRGLHTLLAIVPMVLAAAVGAGLARHLNGHRRHRHGWTLSALWTRRAVTAVVSAGILALVLGLVRPAGTEPILAPGGRSLAGSVAELTTVRTGGHRVAMMIRGDSSANPVLLYLAGGPGGTDIGGLRRNGQELEQAFIVATYDQRGAGKSYDALDPTPSLTLDGAVADVIEVSRYLRARFHQDKIYLVGNSWGSVLGVLAAQQHPDLFAAFVGAGQMVDIRATDRLYYRDTLAWARRTRNTSLERQLTGNGPPPYADALDYEPLLGSEQQVYPYDDSGLGEGASGFSENLFHEEYSLLEQLHNLAAFLDSFTVLYPQLQKINLRTQVTQLKIPVYLVQGRHETRARAEPAAEWFALLEAPTKRMIIFERAGHRSLFQEPHLFFQVMTRTVVPQSTA